MRRIVFLEYKAINSIPDEWVTYGTIHKLFIGSAQERDVMSKLKEKLIQQRIAYPTLMWRIVSCLEMMHVEIPEETNNEDLNYDEVPF